MDAGAAHRQRRLELYAGHAASASSSPGGAATVARYCAFVGDDILLLDPLSLAGADGRLFPAAIRSAGSHSPMAMIFALTPGWNLDFLSSAAITPSCLR